MARSWLHLVHITISVPQCTLCWEGSSHDIFRTTQTSVRSFSLILFALLHIESQYSNVSSPPLLDYPCRISLVYWSTGDKTRIVVGPVRKFIFIQGKFFPRVIGLSMDSHNNSHFSLPFMPSRTLYFISPAIQACRRSARCWVWTSSQPRFPSQIISSWLRMNRFWVLSIFKKCALCYAHTGSSKLFLSGRNVPRVSPLLTPRRICSCQVHQAQRIALM